MAELDAVILAAGLSQRMGRNKLLLPFGESTVIGRFLTNFPYGLFAQVIVVIADRAVEEIARSFPVQICRNEHPEEGKSSSIRLGLEAGESQRGILFSVADQPLLTGATIMKLVEVFRNNPSRIVLPKVSGTSASPVIFPADLRIDLQKLQGDEGGRKVIQNHFERKLAVDFSSPDEFYDIDTDDNYQDILRRWKKGH